MDYEEIYLDFSERADKALDVLKDEFRGLRAGRATPGLVDSLKVEYYGSPTPLKQLANISVPDPRMIVIKPFDPTSLKEIEKAIQSSELGVNPATDGKVIRLNIPPLSEERRRQLSNRAKEVSEKARVAVRNVRRDAIKNAEAAEKEKVLTEDEKFQLKEDLDEETRSYEKKITDLVEKKTAEIMEI